MRLIATILSVYVLLLAFVPCADEFSIETSQEQALLQDDYHPDEEGHSDFCTPFCHCHCCHSHVTFMDTNWHAQVITPFSEKRSAHLERKEYLFPFSIFQPPRV